MKAIQRIGKYQILCLILALSIFPIYSCSSNSDDMTQEPEGSENPEPENPADNKVRTLVANLGANDGLSIDSNGIIYASNYGMAVGTEVVSFDPTSLAISTAVNNVLAPTGNITDGTGNTLVVHNARPVEPQSNQFIGDVIRIDSDGNRTELATLPGFPSGITLDEQGNVYISNFAFPGIHRISPDGEITVYVQDQRLAGGVGIDFDDNGNLYVGNFITGDVLRIDGDKAIEVLATIPTKRENFVIGYITYFDNAIFATAPGEHVIYKITLSGETSIFAGSGTEGTEDGSLLQASFDTPNGIVGDVDRNVLYVTEAEGAALRLIDLN
ncbi:MAG: hypothetical protein AAF765_10845 [Bacteroidota bacterium]